MPDKVSSICFTACGLNLGWNLTYPAWDIAWFSWFRLGSYWDITLKWAKAAPFLFVSYSKGFVKSKELRRSLAPVCVANGYSLLEQIVNIIKNRFLPINNSSQFSDHFIFSTLNFQFISVRSIFTYTILINFIIFISLLVLVKNKTC
jgi:hypothetical protein